MNISDRWTISIMKRVDSRYGDFYVGREKKKGRENNTLRKVQVRVMRRGSLSREGQFEFSKEFMYVYSLALL